MLSCIQWSTLYTGVIKYTSIQFVGQFSARKDACGQVEGGFAVSVGGCRLYFCIFSSLTSLCSHMYRRQ